MGLQAVLRQRVLDGSHEEREIDFLLECLQVRVVVGRPFWVTKLSLICPTMLHLTTLSKHSDGLPNLKSALYIDTLPLLSTSTDL